MRSFVLALVLVAACYREQATPLTNNPEPLALVPAKCDGDDRRYPVEDVFPEGRLRTQASGTLATTPGKRAWSPPAAPDFIPPAVGTLELLLVDDVERGYLAFYREPYGLDSCQLGSTVNCAYEARYYDRGGRQQWALRLDRLLARPDHLEIQDIRLAGGVLYFNEACQSYASSAGGQCSSLVAVEPRTGRVLWRTPPLVSNGRFVVAGCYVIAGYGFTAEPDAIHLVERATGAVLQKIAVSSSPEQYRVRGERLDVELYSGIVRRYRLLGLDGPRGRLESLDRPEAIYGGAAYGGLGYGGQGYGGASYGGP